MNVNMLFLTASQKPGQVDILILRVGCQVEVPRPCVSMHVNTSLRAPLEKQSEELEVWSTFSSCLSKQRRNHTLGVFGSLC